MLGFSETAHRRRGSQATATKRLRPSKIADRGRQGPGHFRQRPERLGQLRLLGDTQKLTGYSACPHAQHHHRGHGRRRPLIDAALGAGANQLQGVSFTAENNDAAYDQALKLAFEKAREKAEVLAAAAGMKLGALESLAEGSVDSYGPYINAKYAVEDGAGQGAPTQVDTGLVTVSATVTAVFEMKG